MEIIALTGIASTDSIELNGNSGTQQIVATGTIATKGDTGATGPTGATGEPGTNGQGVPTGGTTGQQLAKINGTDYNTQWVNPVDISGKADTSTLTAHTSNTSNPHSVTKAQVGLGSVPNTDFTASIAAKQDTLVSGTTIKTINSTSILGSGDIVISGGGGGGTWGSITGTLSSQTDLDSALTGKEDVSNKDTTTTLGTSDTLYPSQKAVKTYVDTTAGAYVPLAGGTMTGNLIAAATGSGTTGAISTNWITIRPANGTAGGASFFLNNGASGTPMIWEIFNNPSGTMGFYDKNVSKQPLTILPVSGNVGIGDSTRTPTEKLQVQGNIASNTNTTYNLGTPSLYWLNTYTQKLNLNSTASLDGSTAGQINPTGSFGSTNLYNGASLALYNTSDQTTNYERVRQYWGGNAFIIESGKGGTGINRDISIRGNASEVLVGYGVSNWGISLKRDGTSYDLVQVTSSGMVKSSGNQYALGITPTISQSGTAGYTALLINPTETATGSGAKNLIDAQVGGTSKFKVANTGDAEITTSSAGVILKDSSGGRWRVTVDTSGALTTTSI